ncbi:MAG: c-type cytochrome biogenesis protein CcsB [ANME-2 cluster archaeon]|nr:MAG: c-type cytochrome biogenesis protein CcsB [ANME-2 cluster archaeon]
MGQLEWVLYLTASSLYAISAVWYILSIAFMKEKWLRHGAISAALGILPHSLALYIRWVESGHGPYMTMHEVFSSYAWVSVAVFLLAIVKIKKVRIAGLVVMPIIFIMMGIGATLSTEIAEIPPSLSSFWLIAHVGFAKLTFGSILIGTGLAVIYLLKERKKPGSESMVQFLNRFPEKNILDELSYQFVTAGFLFLSVMIAAGAIWAYQTWGRYWAWDPIESWSLIAWLVYGIYLHQRLNSGWKGKKAAYFLIFAIFVLVFSLFGTGIVYEGLHSAYMV